MMASRWRSFAIAAAAALFTAVMAAGQSTSSGDLGVGKLLVSSRGLGDPNFAETVVLLIQYDQHGAVGLMINRRTEATISRVLKDVDTAKRGSDEVYIGGPVELDVVMALMKAQKKPDEAASVLNDVYVVSTKPSLEKALAASSGDVRVYLGYCGWAGGQLENELRLGGWWIFAGDDSKVFDPHPDTLWSRLITRTEQEVVQAGGGTWSNSHARKGRSVPPLIAASFW
jgi:putative transcriptional regulator